MEDFNFFIDHDNATEKKVPVSQIATDIKNILASQSQFAYVITRSDVESRHLPFGMHERQIGKTYYRGRSGEVIAIPKPFYVNTAKKEANHMTGYSYDRMVPIVLSGFGIKPGLYAEKAEVVDIAPTISFLLGTVPPALSEGKVLSQILKSSDRR